MNRPSKKEIKEAIEKLKDKSSSTGASSVPDHNVGKLAAKKSSQRIRKKGV